MSGNMPLLQWKKLSPQQSMLQREGRQLFSNMEDKDIRIRPKCQEAFIMRGSYHILANQLKIGWHVDFFERLKQLLIT